jgi:hypothetical protein
MTKSHDHKPINFVGLYFIDEERYETGQIIAQISDSYYLAQFDSIEKGAPPPRLEVLSSVEFTNSATVVARDLVETAASPTVYGAEPAHSDSSPGRRRPG